MPRGPFGQLPSEAETLNADSKRWLLCATDPFPDYEIPPSGFPDMDASATVVQCVKGSFQVSKPLALAADATWDAHFFSLPDLGFYSSSRARVGDIGANTNTITVTAGTTFYAMAPLNCVTVATGQATVPYIQGTGATWNPTGYEWAGVNLGSYLNGGCRVVAAGFEVRNVTAELNKQGTVTTYTIPQTAELETYHVSYDGGATFYNHTFRSQRSPPGSVNQAMLMSGSRQWEASEGVYIPLTFSGVNNPISGGSWVHPIYKAADSVLGGVCFGNMPIANNSNASATRPCPLNTSGAYFTGLSPSTTLVCTWKFFLERAPGPNLPDLAALATKSAGYDPDVLKLYSMITNAMPPGCKAGDNDAGDWFRGVMSKIKDLAPAVAPMVAGAFGIPPQVGTYLGKAVSNVAGQLAEPSKKSGPIIPRGATPGGQTWSPKGSTAAARPRTTAKPARPKGANRKGSKPDFSGTPTSSLRVTRKG
jgi:hypothetical protein